MTSLFQFSIRGLLAGVTLVALGIAALLNANAWWEAATWSVAVLALAAAVILAVYRREEGRAYWLGFAVFGGLYLGVLVFGWTTNTFPANWLPTSRLAQLAYDKLLPESRRTDALWGPIPGGQAGAGGGGMMPAAPGGPGGGGDPFGGMDVGGMSGMPGMAGGPGLPAGMPGGPPLSAFSPNPNYIPIGHFLNIAHALWLLLIAACGGKFGQLAYRTRPAEPAR